MAELSTIARPYAEAVFELAGDNKEALSQWSDLLDEMAAIAALPDVAAALSDPRLNNQQRAELFVALLKTPLSTEASNFVQMLVDNERFLVLSHIAQQFEYLKNKAEGIARADIYTAYPLDDKQLADLLAVLQGKFGLTLTPVVTVKPELIGGVRVIVGDQVLDTSVQAQLTRMRDTLAA